MPRAKEKAIHERMAHSARLEPDPLGLGRAMLALFVSSLLMLAVQLAVYALGAQPASLGGGVLYFVALIVGEALMLRWCLTWFGWTISLKAAVVARLVAGIAGFVGLVLLLSVAPLRNAVVLLLLTFVVEYLVAGWIVMLTAVPLDGDTSSYRHPTSTTIPTITWQDDPASLYTAEQFREDLQRAGAGSPSA